MLHHPLGCPKAAQYTAIWDPGAISEPRARREPVSKKLAGGKVEPGQPQAGSPGSSGSRLVHPAGGANSWERLPPFQPIQALF